MIEFDVDVDFEVMDSPQSVIDWCQSLTGSEHMAATTAAMMMCNYFAHNFVVCSKESKEACLVKVVDAFHTPDKTSEVLSWVGRFHGTEHDAAKSGAMKMYNCFADNYVFSRKQ